MVLLDKLWDEVVAGPHPEHGLGKLRKINTHDLEREIGKNERSTSAMSASPGTPSTPVTPGSPSSSSARKDNVWRSVFNPGSNLNTKNIGAEIFDKPQPRSPTVYDWLYSGETRSKHR
ncbi:hypothetical protein Ancab_039075 [Ancistrocladus abbreviatus]